MKHLLLIPILCVLPLRLAAAEPDLAATVDQDSLIAAINERIAGKEDLPAEEVFENIEILAGFPAGRVPMIMKMGFGRSLGVDCTHCHELENLASDAKAAKKVAREMWRLAGDINRQLAAIEDLDSERPVVNCTTCHRGRTKPATNLD